jgi:AraC-like DNA-binding protein
MSAQEDPPKRYPPDGGPASGRLRWRAEATPIEKAKPDFDGEQLSFFHAIEQFGILKSFQHDLYLLTGLPFDFVDLRMRSSDKLQAHRLFTSFCTLVNSTHLGRLACERDDQKAASTCLKGSGCLARRCHLGLIDITTPIVINGRAVGLLCTGQLLYHRPTQQSFQRIQKHLASLGVDVAKARQAYFKLPVLEKQRVMAIMDLMQMVAELIGNQRLLTLKTVVLHHPLSKALDFMEAHYAEPLTLPLVAKAAGLSVSRLAHVFKAQVGMSITAYLNMVRVNWARYYLTNSSLRVSETAFQVGFGNLSHFNHVFRRATGLSPTQYRRQQTSTRK